MQGAGALNQAGCAPPLAQGSDMLSRLCGPPREAGQSALLSATRFEALRRLSKVPASVHQPSSTSHVISPAAMYSLLTSVISSSPRALGLSLLVISKTRWSYM